MPLKIFQPFLTATVLMVNEMIVNFARKIDFSMNELVLIESK